MSARQHAAATSPAYHRDAVTWASFAAPFGFGILNAVLGPVLPFLRAELGLTYLTVLGTPALLSTGLPWLVVVGIVMTGIGTGATFPLASALHVQASPRGADGALGQTLTVAALAEIVGPLGAGAIAQVADLRVGLLVVPGFAVVAGLSLLRHPREAQR